ncbi:hypothetical protein EWB00_009808 [Schistosoma japonicum]|uniref:Uncharacterized protein n=1 Tax=Schistosoma japonicum TaxID=6182 RepID=A0A4Z2DQP8_SCHJA|nr:hypothetical protein EWB00_009808 [Schistosoma japonicum]
MSDNDFRVLDDDTQFMDMYPNGLSLADLLPFYDAVAKCEPPKLEWACPGKIDPNVQRETTTVRTEINDNPIPKVSESLSSIVKLKEFDFDESINQPSVPSVPLGATAQNANLPLRRLAGTSRHPPRQPRVASMDKILNDFFKTRKDPSSPAVVVSEVTSSVIPSAVLQHCTQSSDFSQASSVPTDTNNINNNSAEKDKQEALAVALAKTSVSPQVAYNHPVNMPSGFTSYDNHNAPVSVTDQGVSVSSLINTCDETTLESTKSEERDIHASNINLSSHSAVDISNIPVTSVNVNNISQNEVETH